MMDNSNFNRVQAVINLDNIRDNITAMKRLIDGDKKMLAVIKADAYGHGAVEVAEALDDLVDFFAVAFIDEALELRRANIDKPILILGYTDPSDYELLLRYAGVLQHSTGCALPCMRWTMHRSSRIWR